MSTLSAISWGSASVLHDAVSVSTPDTINSVGGAHDAIFALGTNSAVYMKEDSGGFVSLGGYALQISANFDSAGNPEVYAIGGDNAVYVNHLTGGGWVDLGGDVTAICATADNTVYALSPNKSVYVNYGNGWVDLGGDMKAISGGLKGAGSPEVYAIGSNNAAYVNSGSGWVDLGGYVTAISAAADNTVYAIGGNNSVYANSGSGWVDQGGYVVEISATTNGSVFARGGGLVTSIWVSSPGAAFVSVGSTPLANPQADTSYSPAPAGAPLYNSGGPSYLDSEQGVVGDCWLLASLAEVADRDPQVITHMFIYNGTTVDDGATVGLYTVQFFDGNGTRFGIQVDTELPSGGAYYDHPTNEMGTQTLWVALAEKAYAEANGLGLVSSSNEDRGSYDALNDSNPAFALQAITGLPATDYSINPNNIAADWNAGCLIVLCTPNNPASSYIVADHCYAVVGYNADAASGDPFEVFNPWGSNSSGWASPPGITGTKYGLFWANAAFISQNFTSQSIGTGATNTNDLAGTANKIIELLTLDNARPKKAPIIHGIGSNSDNPTLLP